MLQPSLRVAAHSPAARLTRSDLARPHLRIHDAASEAEVQERLAKLLDKIDTRSAVVGIVGLGYVGLPFAVEKGKVGYRVLGIEQNLERAERVNRGENYIPDI